MRVGLIGFGKVAEHSHLPAWLSLPDIDVAAVADRSPRRWERARDLVGSARFYPSALKLIDEADIDILDICTPPSTHADLMIAALDRGIGRIICEKPLVLSLDEYARVARARSSRGARVASVDNWSYSDLNRHVSEVVSKGLIGAVENVVLRAGRTDIALGDEGWMPRWRTEAEYSGGGVILDHGWHQLYLLLHWMGKVPTAVRATTRTIDLRHYPVEDEALIEVIFEDGTGSIELSWTAPERSNDGVIRGSLGTIEILDDRIVVANGKLQTEKTFASKLSQSSYHPDWFRQVFEHNVLATDRAEADRNFAQAGLLVSSIEAAYRSARENGAYCRTEPPDLGMLAPEKGDRAQQCRQP